MARAIQMVRHGEPEELSIVDVADRPSQRGEVAIDVHAIGANFLDLMVVRGTYQILAPLPFSPGKEVAGIVSAVGKRNAEFRVGDCVIACPTSFDVRRRTSSRCGKTAGARGRSLKYLVSKMPRARSAAWPTAAWSARPSCSLGIMMVACSRRRAPLPFDPTRRFSHVRRERFRPGCDHPHAIDAGECLERGLAC
jgi:hypothetical protein